MSNRETAIALWHQGKNIEQISEITGISTRSISVYLNSHTPYVEVQEEEKRKQQERNDAILNAWRSQKKKNIAYLARRFNMSRQRVQQILNKYQEYRDSLCS